MNPKDDEVVKIFGDTVRMLRKQKRLSMVQLAIDCGVDYTTIFNIEKGKVNTTITMVARIAKALKVKPSVLMDSNNH